jgi:Domain of unknown function (DUF4185)
LPQFSSLIQLAAGMVLGAIVGNRPAIAQDKPHLAKIAVSFSNPRPDPSQNKLFESTSGWIGGDGFQSLRLDSNRILWLFSDTWIGRVENNRRVDATIVNNTLAIQFGIGESATSMFSVRYDQDKRPTAYVVPEDGVGWFWMQSGIQVEDKLYWFLTKVDRSEGTGVFAFRIVGQSLGVVSGLDRDPLEWTLTQTKIPMSQFDSKREIAWGSGMLEVGEYLYIYGSDEDIYPKFRDRHLIVARVLKQQIANFSRWEFFDGEQWTSDSLKAKRIVPKMASDCSVMFLPKHNCYLLTYTEGGLSSRIMARTAEHPWGPWSDAVVAYESPEMKSDSRLFCYNGKAQPLLATEDEIVVSYVVNSFELSQIAEESGLYVPRFVRLKIAAAD